MYKSNKSKCGRNKLILSEDKLEEVNQKLNNDWSLDATAGRDKFIGAEEVCSTSALYRMMKNEVIDSNKLRRKGKRKRNKQVETRGKVN